jgi:hypothetical protein
MILPVLALMLLQPSADDHVIAVEDAPDLGQPIDGSDFLLIAEMARRPELRKVNLACYRIYTYEYEGARQVSFLEARDRMVENTTEEGTEIVWYPPDPKCPSLTFVIDDDGHVARVIRSRD